MIKVTSINHVFLANFLLTSCPYLYLISHNFESADQSHFGGIFMVKSKGEIFPQRQINKTEAYGAQMISLSGSCAELQAKK